MVRQIACLLAWLCFVGASAGAEEFCDRGVCFQTEKLKNGFSYSVHNTTDIPVTVTLKIVGENIQTTSPVPFSTGVGAREQVKILSAVQATPGVRWQCHNEWHWIMGLPFQKHDDSYVYRLPFAEKRPVKIMQGYGGHFSHQSMGGYQIDFDLPEGSAVLAARPGRVIDLEKSRTERTTVPNDAVEGNFILILHDDGTLALYLHLKFDGVVVQPGQRVDRGQLIGYSGNTGYSTAPHLHFEVMTRTDAFSRQTIPTRFATSTGVKDRLMEGLFVEAAP